MAIPASQIVNVLPRVLSGTGADLAFNGLFLDDSALLQSGVVTSFATADEVADCFGTDSDEYRAAAVYFGGYQGSQIKPSRLYFYRLTPQGAAAWVRGAGLSPSTALAEIKALEAGDFNITIDGVLVEISALDLSGVESLSGAADALETAINGVEGVSGVSVAYSSITNSFVITAANASAEGSITAAGGSIATAMGLAANVTISAGADPRDVTGALQDITAQFQNFVTFAFVHEPSDDDATLAAQWASKAAAAGTMYLFVLQDSDTDNLTSGATSVISEQLKAAEIGATAVCYPDTAVAAFIMGVAASIDWSQRQGTLTFAFKRQSGLGASINAAGAALALQEHGVNYVGNYATRNDSFVWLYNGAMLGEWSWIDAYLNSIWLCNACQVQLMAMFESNRRIPYTDAGYSIIRANIRDVMNRALFNGVCDPGVTLSEAQKATLTQELGGDYSDEIFSNGYYLQIETATANIRQARQSPACNLVYTYGGSVHKLTVPAIAVV